MKSYIAVVIIIALVSACSDNQTKISAPISSTIALCSAGLAEGTKAKVGAQYENSKGNIDADFFIYLRGMIDPNTISNEKYSEFVKCVLEVDKRIRPSATHTESEWLTAAQYQNLWKRKSEDGFYPTTLEGKCEEGSEYFKVNSWKSLPLGAAYYSYHAMTAAFYADRLKTLSQDGYSLVYLSNFRDCSGGERSQATWFRGAIDSQKVSKP